jgi:hypothetical protein
MARLALECAGHSERVGVAPRRERRHYESAQVSVQLVGGHHHARSRLPDLASTGRVEIDQEHVAATNPRYRQRQSFSSNRVEVGLSSRRSSSRSRMRRAASAQPDRGLRRERITTAPPRTWSSTCSSRPASSITGLGRRTPRELPIRMSRVFTGAPRTHIVLPQGSGGPLCPDSFIPLFGDVPTPSLLLCGGLRARSEASKECATPWGGTFSGLDDEGHERQARVTDTSCNVPSPSESGPDGGPGAACGTDPPKKKCDRRRHPPPPRSRRSMMFP